MSAVFASLWKKVYCVHRHPPPDCVCPAEGVDPFSGLMDDVFPFDVSAMDDAIGPSLLSKGAGPAADDILASAKNRLLAAPPAPAQPQAPPPATAVAFAFPSAPTAASFTTAAGGPSSSAFAQDDLDDLLSGGGTGGNVAKYDELDLDDLSVIGFGSAEADAQAGLDDLFDDLPSTPAAGTSAAGAGSSDAK